MTNQASDCYDGPGDRRASRSVVRGQSGVVAAGHPLAAAAGHEAFQKGGNAIDAGVAAGIATNVVHHDMTSFGGVAPIILRSAADDAVHTISGLGRWPRAASRAYFDEHHHGELPQGLPCSVVPAAPDAWLTALESFGRLSFGAVADPTIRLARNGYPVYEFQRANIAKRRDAYTAYPSTAAVFLPDG